MNKQFEYTYQQELDTLRYTPEQKAHIAALVSAQSSPQPRHSKKIRRTVLIAAAVAVLLAVSAGAAGALKTAAEALSPIFGGNAAQTEVLDKIGRPVGASDTRHGVTITADAIIADQYNAAIVYTIRRDSGERVLPDGVSASAAHFGGVSGVSLSGQDGGHESARFTEGADGSLQYVQTITADQPLSPGEVTAEFEDLGYFDRDTGSAVTLVDGRWKFSFSFDYEDSSIALPGGGGFQQDGMSFAVDEIVISPISLRVSYTVTGVPDYSVKIRNSLKNVELLLTKTDGTVLDLSLAGGGITPEGEVAVCTKGDVFDEIIPLEEMESVSIGGVTYPVTASPAAGGISSWEDCQSIYTTVVHYSGEDDDQEYLKIAERSEQLLHLLEDNVGAFVMDAYNYQSIDDDGTPLYEMNGLSYPIEIDPNGYSIRVSKNYFNFNPVETADGSNLFDGIIYDDTTLNILVPEKYQSMEEQIIEAYRAHFYCEKVTAADAYNSLAGVDKQADISEDDLSIHIIYVKDNQQYFTFNAECACQTDNLITDPIVEIYTYNVHCNYAHSFMSQWVYFSSDSGSAEAAFAEIQPYVQQCGGSESFQKVYAICGE